MRVRVSELKVGDIVSDVPFGKTGFKFNAKVISKQKLYSPRIEKSVFGTDQFKEIDAAIVSLFCVRKNGTCFHSECKLPDDTEWEVIYREDKTDDIG